MNQIESLILLCWNQHPVLMLALVSCLSAALVATILPSVNVCQDPNCKECEDLRAYHDHGGI